MYTVSTVYDKGDDVLDQVSVTLQMKVILKCFPVVLFITLYKVVLTFETMDEILKCD